MLDLGWSELLLIGIVALIVVGPKDLPKLFRNIGRWVGKARGLASEFQRAMNAAADETGVKDMARDLKSSVADKDLGLDAIRDLNRNPKNWVRDQVTGKGDAAGAAPDARPGAQPAGDMAIVRQRKPAAVDAAPPPDEAADDLADLHDSPPQAAGGADAPAGEAARPTPASAAPSNAPTTTPTTAGPGAGRDGGGKDGAA